MITESVKEQLRSTVFLLHGGVEKFDCWLTRTADEMADLNSPMLTPISTVSGIPPQAMNLMNDPHIVVDSILGFVDQLSLFDYELITTEVCITVIDQTYRHVVEVVPFTEENLKSLAKKYGVEDAIS